ncbi:MAG: hypothetical protein GY795_36290 [Desulfobacterales bacterium]|nr:hypothetical protein [Desulfobacterales bacterium]
MEFDTKSAIQGRHTNNLASVFLLIIVITCLYGTITVTTDSPLSNILFFFATIFFSYFIVGAQSELSEIKKITNAINGNRDHKKQYIKGRYENSDIEFFLGDNAITGASINYSIIVDTKSALSQKKSLQKIIGYHLGSAHIRGYELLITDTSIVLSKLFWTASQLKADEAKTIYKILYQVCNQFLPEYSKEKTLDSQKKSEHTEKTA